MGAEQQIDQIEHDIQRAEQRLRTLPKLFGAQQEIRGRAANARRTISATVDVAGAVQSLEIADGALADGGRRLAAELMLVLGQARADAARQAKEAAEVFLADDPGLLAQLHAEETDS